MFEPGESYQLQAARSKGRCNRSGGTSSQNSVRRRVRLLRLLGAGYAFWCRSRAGVDRFLGSAGGIVEHAQRLHASNRQRVHSGLAVSKNTTQFPSPLVPSADDFTERNGLTCEFSTDGAAQKLAFVEGTHPRHVSWINSRGHAVADEAARSSRCGGDAGSEFRPLALGAPQPPQLGGGRVAPIESGIRGKTRLPPTVRSAASWYA